MKLIWCNGLQRSMLSWRGQSVIGICALFIYIYIYIYIYNIYIYIYIYISASRSAKFGVVVFKASLLESGGQFAIDPCYTHYTP